MMTTDAHTGVISRLAATTAWLRDAVSVLRPERLEARQSAGTWSAGDVIRHVRAADAIVATRIWHVLVRDGAPLPAFDEQAWARLYAASGLPLTEQVEQFALRRAELAGVLRGLAPEDWSRAGEHETSGTLTLADLCGIIVEHEAEHRSHLDAIVAACRSPLTAES